jgi:predicted transcriptional regulator
MKDDDLLRIKHFIRVSFELEEALRISTIEKKVLLRVVDLWGQKSKAPTVTEAAMSVPNISESTVHRHLKSLVKKGLLTTNPDRQDRRTKFLGPSTRLLKVLALKI